MPGVKRQEPVKDAERQRELGSQQQGAGLLQRAVSQLAPQPEPAARQLHSQTGPQVPTQPFIPQSASQPASQPTWLPPSQPVSQAAAQTLPQPASVSDRTASGGAPSTESRLAALKARLAQDRARNGRLPPHRLAYLGLVFDAHQVCCGGMLNPCHHSQIQDMLYNALLLMQGVRSARHSTN